MNIYLASAWSNPHLDNIAAALRGQGHEVYDFRENGIGWSGAPRGLEDVLAALNGSAAQGRYLRDCAALVTAQALVCVLPCGRSAHVELGLATGLAIPTVLVHDGSEPELMHLVVDAFVALEPAEELDQALAMGLAAAKDHHQRWRHWYANYADWNFDTVLPQEADDSAEAGDPAGAGQFHFPKRRFKRPWAGSVFVTHPTD